jgi:hypothetical protein
MLVSCKNCGGSFNEGELAQLKPPMHPWALTPVGQRALAMNNANGAHLLCPKCGQNTLAAASTAIADGR